MNMRRIWLTTAAVIAAAAMPFAAVDPIFAGAFVLPPAGAPPYPVPATPAGVASGAAAPATVESAPAYVPQASCDPVEKPGLTAFKQLVLAQYPGTTDWGSVRNCTDDGISEHLEGRAWDWHADVNDPSAFAAAANVLQWLTADAGYNAKRLGILYIGYNHRIWGAYRAAEGWRVLGNSNPHTDHVHFSFTWSGALKRTSFWTGTAASEDYGPCRPYAGQPAPIYSAPNPNPCPKPAALPANLTGAKLLWRGSTGDLVTQAQNKLGSTVSGKFGAETAAAVIAFQRRSSLPVTGAVDAATWFALAMSPPAATQLPVAPSVPAAPTPPSTSGGTRRVALFQGNTGPAVTQLQTALKMAKRNRTGYFGPLTKSRVKAWQRAHKATPTGIAKPGMLRRLGL